MKPEALRALLRVGSSSFLFFVAFGCLLPVFPLWARQLGGSLTNVGIATTLAAGVGLVLARPVAARLMEGRRRAPTMMLGAVVAASACEAFPWVPRFDALLVLRLAQGFGFGLLGTAAISAVTDLAPPERRGQVLGYFGAGNALSLLVGPAVGAWFGRTYGLPATFHLCAGLTIASIVLLPGLDEPPKPPVDGSVRLLDAFTGRLRPLVVAHFVTLLLHGAVISFLPLRLEGHTGWMSVEAFFAMDALVVVVFRGAIGHRFDVWGRAPFMVAGLVAFTSAGALLAIGGADWVYLLSGALYGLAFGAYIPAASALVGDLVPETHRARGFALFLLAFDLSMACGGAVFGPVADLVGLVGCFAIAAVMPAVALAVLAATRPWREAARGG